MYWERLLHFFMQAGVFKSDWNALERMSIGALKPKKKRRNTTNYCDFLTFRAVPTFYGSQPKRKITHVSFIKSLHHSRTCYNKFKCFIMIIIICDQFLLNNQLSMRTKQFIMKRERVVICRRIKWQCCICLCFTSSTKEVICLVKHPNIDIWEQNLFKKTEEHPIISLFLHFLFDKWVDM